MMSTTTNKKNGIKHLSRQEQFSRSEFQAEVNERGNFDSKPETSSGKE